MSCAIQSISPLHIPTRTFDVFSSVIHMPLILLPMSQSVSAVEKQKTKVMLMDPVPTTFGCVIDVPDFILLLSTHLIAFIGLLIVVRKKSEHLNPLC